MWDIRATTRFDNHHLLDIDLKCFDTPWDANRWREAGQFSTGCVVTWEKRPVGMVLFHRNFDGYIEIDRLGVKPDFRRRGVGARLMLNVVFHARELNASQIITVIPESHIAPGQPHDVSSFLSKLGFKAFRPFIKDRFFSYGKHEDGVLFSLTVPMDEQDASR